MADSLNTAEDVLSNKPLYSTRSKERPGISFLNA